MHVFSKNILFICFVFLGNCLGNATQSCHFDGVAHHAHVYNEAAPSFFQRPELVQQCLALAMYNANFGLVESYHHYEEKTESIMLVCKTDKSWIGLLLDLRTEQIFLDSSLDGADEKRFFAAKQFLDVLFGDYIYSQE